MRVRHLLWIGAAGLGVFALGVAWQGARATREIDAKIGEIEVERSGLAFRTERAEAKIDAANRAAAAWSAERSAPARPTKSRRSRATLVAQNPALRPLYLRSYRAALTQRYLPLYQALGLTPAQRTHFEDLMMNAEEDRLDLAAVALAQGVAESDPAILAQARQQDAQLRLAQAELLGQAGYQQLQDFGQVLPAESLVNDVSRLVAYSAAPLTLAQATQLIDVVKSAGGKDPMGGAFDPAALNSNQVLDQASGFLSPPQLAALRSDVLFAPVEGLIKQYYQSAPK